MSVYTPVDAADLTDFLADYPAGKLRDFHGIADGIENTNYLVSTTQGHYILTLFESSSISQIRFALELMSQLAQQLSCFAQPVPNQDGEQLSKLNSKPATLVSCLPGKSVTQPVPRHCQQIGAALAHLHLVGQGFAEQKSNPRGRAWRLALAEKLRPHLAAAEQQLLDDELIYQDAMADNSLPQGIIHADLFRDNALFDDGKLSGIIDLYNCGRDNLLYDLAITANDWCTQEDGHFDAPRLTALLSAYTQLRPVSAEEMSYWPTALRKAALRFWLSRLRNAHFPPAGELTVRKDPAVFKQLLEIHRENRPVWPR